MVVSQSAVLRANSQAYLQRRGASPFITTAGVTTWVYHLLEAAAANAKLRGTRLALTTPLLQGFCLHCNYQQMHRAAMQHRDAKD